MTQQIMLNAMPGALIARLLLAPHDLGRIAVAIDLRFEFVVREWIELLQAHDGNIIHAPLTASRAYIVVDLAAAEDHTLRACGINVVAFPDYRLETAFGQLVQRRHRLLVPEHALRAEDDERLAIAPQHLT